MAIFHTRFKMFGRSGHDCVSVIAYRTATRLENKSTGVTWDYTKKNYVDYVDLILPEDAPQWAKDLKNEIKKDRQKGVQKLTEIVEAAEKRKDAQVWREFEFALPRELTDVQCKKLADHFLSKHVAPEGMLVLSSMHMDRDKETGARKPHCHAMMVTRRMEENGFSKVKELDWNRKTLPVELRYALAQEINICLAENGHDVRVDHRSYAEQGIDLVPQPKKGPKYDSMIENHKPGALQRLKEFNLSQAINLYKVMRNPEIVLDIVSREKATFMWGDVQEVLSRHVKDAEVFKFLEECLLQSTNLVVLKEKYIESDEDSSKPFVYTTKRVLEQEKELLALRDRILLNKTHGLSNKTVSRAIENLSAELKENYGGRGLTLEQKTALKGLTGGGQMKSLIGYAGTGKTTILQGVKQAYEAEGYKVFGLAPTNVAAQNLLGSGIKSQTVSKFLYNYAEGRDRFAQKTVLVLDEAGMLDFNSYVKLLYAVEHLGVKLLKVGDGNQLQAVDGGAAFRVLMQDENPNSLKSIRRQEVAWQKEATRLFGEGEGFQALNLYKDKGAFNLIDQAIPDLQQLEKNQDASTLLSFFKSAKSHAGWSWHRMLFDLELKGVFKESPYFWDHIKGHTLYEHYSEWRNLREQTAACLEKLGVDMAALKSDKIRFGLTGKDLSLDKIEKYDTNARARFELIKEWAKGVKENPHRTHLMLAHTIKDVQTLNAQGREMLKALNVLPKGVDVNIEVQKQDTDDFLKPNFAKRKIDLCQGDRIMFLRNDRGMGIKTGETGRVLEVDSNKIKAMVDQKDGTQKEVSFALNLYNYLDHAWAVNINKSQSLTVDHVYYLATVHQYMNLSYVALTRHVKSIKVFASKLDFSTLENVVYSLGRSNEKTTVSDYGDRMIRDKEAILQKTINRLSSEINTVKHFAIRGVEMVSKKLPFDRAGEALKSKIVFEGDRYNLLKNKVFLTQEVEKKENVNDSNVEIPKIIIDLVSEVRNEKDEIHLSIDKIEKAIKNEGPNVVNTDNQVFMKNEHIENVQEQSISKEPQYEKSAPYSPKVFIDKKDVLQRLSHLDMERIFKTHIHRWVSNTKCTQKGQYDLRFGGSGGFAANIQTGRWNSFYKAEGGGIFNYVAQSLEIPYKDAIEHLAKEYGVDKRSYMSKSEYKAMVDGQVQEAEKHDLEKMAKGKERGQKLFKHGQALQGTPGETYLRNTRQIATAALPEDCKYLAPYKDKMGVERSGAVISFVRNEHNEITGFQKIHITKDGQKNKDVDIVKQSGGYLRGSYLNVQKQAGPLFVSEGLETSLSIKEAGVKGTILCGMGISGFRNIPDSYIKKHKQIVFVADWDSENSSTHKVLEKEAARLQSKGADVTILWPAKEGPKCDFNDILKTQGKEEIQTILKNQLSENQPNQEKYEDFKFDIKPYMDFAKETLGNKVNETVKGHLEGFAKYDSLSVRDIIHTKNISIMDHSKDQDSFLKLLEKTADEVKRLNDYKKEKDSLSLQKDPAKYMDAKENEIMQRMKLLETPLQRFATYLLNKDAYGALKVQEDRVFSDLSNINNLRKAFNPQGEPSQKSVVLSLMAEYHMNTRKLETELDPEKKSYLKGRLDWTLEMAQKNPSVLGHMKDMGFKQTAQKMSAEINQRNQDVQKQTNQNTMTMGL